MKTHISIIFMLICAMGIFSSCQNSDSKSVRDAARQSLPKAPVTAAPVTPATPSAPSPTFASTGVAHYTCPNACEGSGGDGAGTCPVCNTTYVHNQAWHNQAGSATPPATPTQTPNSDISVPTTSSLGTPGATPPQTPEPAQNAAGVWHYTCADGCTGGAGSPTACASCGKTLVHNTGYH